MRYNCSDCGVDTMGCSKDYMVHDFLWKNFGNKEGHLCPKCFSKRMGRFILKTDLTKCSTNFNFVLVGGLDFPERTFEEDLNILIKRFALNE